jgi:maleamate amidohydrolase
VARETPSTPADPSQGVLSPIIAKAHASAFFGVPFAAMLAGRETLIVCGASTSGCVRATVVDAMQHGLVPIVPRDCVGDRSSCAHEQALADPTGDTETCVAPRR